MSSHTRRLTIGIRWLAKLAGAIVVVPVFLLLLTEGLGRRGLWTMNPLRLSPLDASLMSILLVACAGMIIGWFNEKLGGEIGLVCALAFLASCITLPEMRIVWLPAVILTVPGFLYLLSWKLSRAGTGRAPLTRTAG